ncbi:MAG: hypothetical protein M3Z33_03280 [Actinomycetota bacterium]|nr:hypothetical protein [Actinomycetota bacterium]
MSTPLLIVLSVVEAVLLVAVLALALIEVRRRLSAIAEGLDTLGSALATVQSQDLRALRPAVEAINAGLGVVLGRLPDVARKAATVAAHVRAR